jgi:uncharacterized protein (TIGR03067 family)
VTEFWSGQQQNAQMVGSQMVFDGDRCTHRVQNISFPATFRLDPTKDPKEIDVTMDANGITLPGIYRFEGDRLVLVMNFFGPERPTHFNKGQSPWWSYFVMPRGG